MARTKHTTRKKKKNTGAKQSRKQIADKHTKVESPTSVGVKRDHRFRSGTVANTKRIRGDRD